MMWWGSGARGARASVLLVVGVAACNVVTGADGLVVADNGGASAGGSATTTKGTSSGTGGASHGASSSSSTSGTTTSSTSGTTTSSTSGTTTSTSSSTSSSSGASTDPTQLCVDTINMLRATRGLPAYTRWTSAETCVDGEATMDGMMMSAHYDFIHNNAPCGSNAEDECPNWAKNPLDTTTGIVACLNQMWAEKNQPGCAGCDTCDFPYSNCTNCTPEGTTVCGHYLNMKSSVLTMVACGFSTTGWYTQDFKP